MPTCVVFYKTGQESGTYQDKLAYRRLVQSHLTRKNMPPDEFRDVRAIIEVTSGAALLWRLNADVDEVRRERVETPTPV
jgi:hypothetical protein